MKRFVVAALVSLAPVVIVQTSAALAEEAAVEAPEVSLDELKKIVETKGATIIDANGDKMYADGHVPGAIHFAKHEKDLASVLPKDKGALIVAYCGGTLCTAWKDAAKAAKQLGYTNVKHFKGGIKGWKDAGQKTEKGA